MNIDKAIEVLKDYSKGNYVGYTNICEAIDTVVSLINTENKTGLDDRLQGKLIEISDSQASLSYKKDKTYTAEDVEAFAEWVDINGYKQILKGVWDRDISYQQKMTTAQLRELWEDWKLAQQRGEESK